MPPKMQNQSMILFLGLVVILRGVLVCISMGAYTYGGW